METIQYGSMDISDIEALKNLNKSERHIEGTTFHPENFPSIKICPNSHNHVSIWPGYGRIPCPDCQRVYVNK
jgi:hypothetical protein